MAASLVSRHRGYHTRGIRTELLFGVSGVSKGAWGGGSDFHLRDILLSAWVRNWLYVNNYIFGLEILSLLSFDSLDYNISTFANF